MITKRSGGLSRSLPLTRLAYINLAQIKDVNLGEKCRGSLELGDREVSLILRST